MKELKQRFYQQYLHVAHMVEYATQLEPIRLKDLAGDYDIDYFPKNLSFVHVIDCIGRYGPINSTALAQRMRMSKSNITKISNQLLTDQLIIRESKEGNRKESYFTLTEKGKNVFHLHNRLHQEEERRFMLLLQEWDSAELETILHFLSRLGEDLEERIQEGEKGQ